MNKREKKILEKEIEKLLEDLEDAKFKKDNPKQRYPTRRENGRRK